LVQASDSGVQQSVDHEEMRQLTAPNYQPALFQSSDLILKDSLCCFSITKTILSFIPLAISVGLVTDLGRFCLSENLDAITGLLIFMTILKAFKIAFGVISPNADLSDRQLLLNGDDGVLGDSNRYSKVQQIKEHLISITSGLLCLSTLFLASVCEGASFSLDFYILLQLVLAANAVDFLFSGACLVLQSFA